jgi:GTP cyclohydrolase I
MKTRHRITVFATCPVDGSADIYQADVFTDGVVFCEEIQDAAKALCREPKTQERLTQELANRLKCRVRTRGAHCRGIVETVCVCEPEI